MATFPISPRTFSPALTLDDQGALAADAVPDLTPALSFSRALTLFAIAIDDAARPLLGRVPLDAQQRFVARIAEALAGSRADRKVDRLRLCSAAATVLLHVAEGSARGGDATPGRVALGHYLALLDEVADVRLHKSMVRNLGRARRLLDAAGRQRLDRCLSRYAPARPPYEQWFATGDRLRIVCQVQDEFVAPWRRFFGRSGFSERRALGKRGVQLARRVGHGDVSTEFELDFIERVEDIFAPMADPDVGAVLFVGHSDWWARVPRNLVRAPDQRGAKLLCLVMCFGKHFYHSLHDRYPDAHVVTSKDPTEDPEDFALLRQLFGGIAQRASWRDIAEAFHKEPEGRYRNFIFPSLARYVDGVTDDDRDGRIDRFDRFCNLSSRRLSSPTGPSAAEQCFLPDPPGLHPRGAAFDPRELAGDRVFEAALMLNSLSYDNYFLDQVNRDQSVIPGGYHAPAPGDFAATRFVRRTIGRHKVTVLSVSQRYARASQAAHTAMVAFEGYRYFATRLSPPQPLLDATLMGLMLTAHALFNADYDAPAAVFAAFLRRYGFPTLDHKPLLEIIEANPRFESGSPKALAALRRALPRNTLHRLAAMTGAAIRPDAIAPHGPG